VVEIDLRNPAMLHGKKGFDRVVWSFENKFKSKVNFLFCDLEQDREESGPCPILASLGCTPRQVQLPEVSASEPVKVPSLDPPPESRAQGGGSSPQAEYNREVWRDWAVHIYEWIALANLGAANRLKAKDNVDPYLSTYSVQQEEGEEERAMGVTRVRFQGMIPAFWILQLWSAVG
jgi:ribonuclease P/MRP protein subunit RPP40